MFLWLPIGLVSLINVVSCTCPSGWTEHESSCYFLSKTPATWPMASAMCKALNNSDLLSIESDAEQRAIVTFAMTASVKSAVWLDGTDIIQEGQWIWAKNLQPLTYNNFPHFDNVDASQNCLVIDSHHHFEWHDRDCTDKHQYICELMSDPNINWVTIPTLNPIPVGK